MPRKIILLTDTGIDGAFAITLALFDPQLEVLALAAAAGNVSAEQATLNVHTLIELLDPPKFPRWGAALPIKYEKDETQLHGTQGLGGLTLESPALHHPHQADKVIVDELHQHRNDVTVIAAAPLTVLARAMDRDANLASSVHQFIIVGGTWHEPGNAGPVTEFHFGCDPVAARQVLRSGALITLIPLDVSRKALFSPTELNEIPHGPAASCQLLRKIVPFGIHASARTFAIEGFYLEDVLGIAAAAIPHAFKTRPMAVDVEVRGELTRGMSVIDATPQRTAPKVNLAVDVDMKAVRAYMESVFKQIESGGETGW